MIENFKLKIENWLPKILMALVLLTLYLSLANFANTVQAQSIDELQNQIEDRNQKIEQLNKEIEIYEKEIEQTAAQANTLKNTIQTIDTSQKKIGTQIKVTENSIAKTQLTIEELAIEIKKIREAVANNTSAIAKGLQNLQQIDDISIVEMMLAYENLGTFWDKIADIRTFQDKVKAKTVELNALNEELSSKLSASEKKKYELSSLKDDLKDQNTVLQSSKNQKNALLKETQNKESGYKKIVAEKIAQMEQFQKELYEFESQLKIAIDPDSYPASKNGILNWPLDNIRITQLFGVTADSVRLYKSGTHNGVDFGASVGTPIKASLPGVIQAYGNTDDQKGCYSYGKWVLVKHYNGLSTLYAHLSVIKVSIGQEVSAGQIIAYSGNTGFSTGPHLHFTVYASQGVRIDRYTSSINCKNVTIPIADPKAYLDPMLYLPKL